MRIHVFHGRLTIYLKITVYRKPFPYCGSDQLYKMLWSHYSGIHFSQSAGHPKIFTSINLTYPSVIILTHQSSMEEITIYFKNLDSLYL